MVLVILRFFSVAFCLLNIRALPALDKTSEADEDECKRIMNGKVATDGQFPFAVSVQSYDEEGDHSHQCSFSLITTKTCLGAAHCLFDDNKNELPAQNFCGVVGAVDQSQAEECLEFSSSHYHSGYVPGEEIHDIAMFIFQSPVTVSEFVKTIPLAGPGIEIAGKDVIALGWGVLAKCGTAANRLRYTNLAVASSSFCKEAYPDIQSTQICIYKEGTGTCEGDSGGPIILADKHIQIATVSYGKSSCDTEPSINTDVRKYTNWITDNADGNPVIMN